MKKFLILFLILFCVGTVYARIGGDGLGPHKALRTLNLNNFGIENLGATDGSLIYGVGLATSSVVTTDGVAGEDLTKFNPVYVSGVTGNKLDFSIADCFSTTRKQAEAWGVAAETSNNNLSVLIRNFGILTSVDTNDWNVADEIFLEKGKMVNTFPSSGTIQLMGYVGRKHSSLGNVFILSQHPTYRIAAPIGEDAFARMGDLGGRWIIYDGQHNVLSLLTPSSMTLVGVGTDVDSPDFVLEADDAGVKEIARMKMVTGADPYLRIGVSDDGTDGALVDVIDIHDTVIGFVNDDTVDIGASGANRPKDYYGSGGMEVAKNIKTNTLTLGGTVQAGGTFDFALQNIINVYSGGYVVLHVTTTFECSGVADFIQYVRHLGDPNTYREFTPDAIKFVAGGLTGMHIIEAAEDRVHIADGDFDCVIFGDTTTQKGGTLWVSTFNINTGHWSMPFGIKAGSVTASAIYSSTINAIGAGGLFLRNDAGTGGWHIRDDGINVLKGKIEADGRDITGIDSCEATGFVGDGSGLTGISAGYTTHYARLGGVMQDIYKSTSIPIDVIPVPSSWVVTGIRAYTTYCSTVNAVVFEVRNTTGCFNPLWSVVYEVILPTNSAQSQWVALSTNLDEDERLGLFVNSTFILGPDLQQVGAGVIVRYWRKE